MLDTQDIKLVVKCLASSENIEARSLSASILLSMTFQPNPNVFEIFCEVERETPFIFKLLRHDSEVFNEVIAIMINNTSFHSLFDAKGFFQNIITEFDPICRCKKCGLLLDFLCNLSRTSDFPVEERYLLKLIEIVDLTKPNKYDSKVLFIVANLCRFDSSRKHVTKKSTFLRHAVISSIDSFEFRLPVLMVVKNCLFERDVGTNFDIDSLFSLLISCISVTNTMHNDALIESSVRVSVDLIGLAIEVLIMLCSERMNREFFREKEIYPFLKELHLIVTEEVKMNIEILVGLLIRDEETIEH